MSWKPAVLQRAFFLPEGKAALMDISKSFSYQFEDIQWPNKLGVGALISLVPVLNFAVVGYEVGILRNVAAGAREPLPQWDNLGGKWRDGLILTLAGLVYAIPVLLMLGVVLAVLAASGALSQSGNAEGFSRPLVASNVILLACFLGFLLVYSLVLSLIRPVILVLFSKEGTFASCFRLGEGMRVIHRQPGLFLTAWGAVILAGLAIGLIMGFVNAVLAWVPCIGWVASLLLGFGTAIYVLTVDGHIYGQFRRQAFEPPSTQVMRPAQGKLDGRAGET